MIQRKKPLRRGGPIQRKARPRRVNPARASERREYSERKAAYLAAHPFDQIKIALCGFDEEKVLARAVGLDRRNASGIFFEGQMIPVSDQIHHRNKGRGARLNDERWWMSTSTASHDVIENRKSWAREHGFLLPIQADADGNWGAGFRALETPEFMKARAGK